MSFSHIIITVDYGLNDVANDMSNILKEHGQLCDVDCRRVGIHRKLECAEKHNYDYILVVNRLLSEIDSVVVRENKTKTKINQNQMKLVDFIHHIWINSV